MGSFKDIRDIKFTKVQHGKMCYKDERMLFNKSVLIADQKQQQKLNWQTMLVSWSDKCFPRCLRNMQLNTQEIP